MSKITKSAKGEDCQTRIPGKCSFDPEQTVLAHRNGGGMGKKSPDYQSAYTCTCCHDVIDGRDRDHCFTEDEIYRFFCDGVWRTQEILRRKGLIKAQG